jgi:hypothetical protein
MHGTTLDRYNITLYQPRRRNSEYVEDPDETFPSTLTLSGRVALVGHVFVPPRARSGLSLKFLVV